MPTFHSALARSEQKAQETDRKVKSGRESFCAEHNGCKKKLNPNNSNGLRNKINNLSSLFTTINPILSILSLAPVSPPLLEKASPRALSK
jgi:hypothetical protein